MVMKVIALKQAHLSHKKKKGRTTHTHTPPRKESYEFYLIPSSI